MPCYNEEEVIGYTVPHLKGAFDRAGYRLELVLVDNGSHDRTAELLKRYADADSTIVFHQVEQNQGYGWGVLSAIPVCRAPLIGIIPADGQVDADDVVHLYEAVKATKWSVIGKVRRRFRMDGFNRKIVSVSYNGLVRVFWPDLRSIDVNGSPKIIPRAALVNMGLTSKGWLLDPEIMVKGHHMGLGVLEFNVFARMRGGGTSQVRPSAVLDFLKTLTQARLTNKWRSEIDMAGFEAAQQEDARLRSSFLSECASTSSSPAASFRVSARD